MIKHFTFLNHFVINRNKTKVQTKIVSVSKFPFSSDSMYIHFYSFSINTYILQEKPQSKKFTKLVKLNNLLLRALRLLLSCHYRNLWRVRPTLPITPIFLLLWVVPPISVYCVLWVIQNKPFIHSDKIFIFYKKKCLWNTFLHLLHFHKKINTKFPIFILVFFLYWILLLFFSQR